MRKRTQTAVASTRRTSLTGSVRLTPPPPIHPEVVALEETEAILFALAVAVEQRDRQTAGHCERLAMISLSLGVALGLVHRDLIALYRGAFLHDVGKVGIPDSILFKPGKLDAEEWVVMRSHPVRGEDICRPMKSLAPVLPIIRNHHERWDGGGYPDGLRGEQIPLLARVVQIADIYDALVSPRPYKPAFTPSRAQDILQEECDKGWRDPALVRLFRERHDEIIPPLAAHSPAMQPGSMQASLSNLHEILIA